MQGNLDCLLRGRKFKAMSDELYAEVRRQYGLRQVEIELLQYLEQVPDATASEICRTLNMNKGHVSQGFDSLCRNAYLTVCPDTKDRRYVRYELTEKGRQFLQRAAEVRGRIEQAVLQGLTGEELAALRSISAKICGNIDRITDSFCEQLH